MDAREEFRKANLEFMLEQQRINFQIDKYFFDLGKALIEASELTELIKQALLSAETKNQRNRRRLLSVIKN